MTAPIGLSPIGGPRAGKYGVSARLEPARETESAGRFTADQQALIRRAEESERAPSILPVAIGADQRNPWGLVLEPPGGGYGTLLRPTNFAVQEITEPDPPPEVEWAVPPTSTVGAHAHAGWRIPGPPRANSPRRDPEWLFGWTHPRAVDLFQRDGLQAGAPVDSETDTPWANAPARDHLLRGEYADAPTATATNRMPWEQPPPKHAQPRAAWEQPPQKDERPRAPWTQPPQKDERPRVEWMQAPTKDRAARGLLEDMPHRDRVAEEEFQNLPPADCYVREAYGPARQADARPRELFGTYGPMDLDHPVAWGKRPQEWVYVQPVYAFAGGDDLRFNLTSGKREPARAIIPPGETPLQEGASIYARAGITAHRIGDDGEPAEPVTLHNVSVRTDVDSWTWQLQAELTPVDARLIAPHHDNHQRIAVTIQGVTWRVIVESLQIQRGVKEDKRQITGRSLTAVLDSPHAPEFSRSSHPEMPVDRLAQDELRDAGEEVTLGWGLPVWNLPRDSWVYSRRTPARTLCAMARALGGILYTSPEADRLEARPRYPAPPHHWKEAQALEVPISYVQAASGRWEQAPRFSDAWIVGEGKNGVIVHAKRQAWEDPERGPVAATVKTSPLITSVDAGAARGRAVIDASGPQLVDQLTMPLTEEVGLVEPGKLLRLYDGAAELTGIARSVAVTASAAGAQQVVELETRAEGYTRTASAEPPAWQPPEGDALNTDVATDDVFMLTAGGWGVRPESGPRDVGMLIPTPTGDPITATGG